MTEPTDLIALVARLRDPERGCPWDVKQDFRSIAACTIEEAYEVAEAIDRGDLDDLKDELGDLLLQVVFHAQMAREQGAFDFHAVSRAICDKLVRRHPHVFGTASVADAEAQTRAWERMKADERAKRLPPGHGAPSALDGIARGLPEWQRALKLQKRGATAGFDWPGPDGALAKLAEELRELAAAFELPASPAREQALQEELGDLLFVAIHLARKAKLDPGAALRFANGKYETRFRAMEQLARERGTVFADLDLASQESLWAEVKRRETR